MLISEYNYDNFTKMKKVETPLYCFFSKNSE